MFGHTPPSCDSCNIGLLGENFYIPVMHSVYCPDCYDRWVNRAVYHSEDAEYEEKKLNQALSTLGVGVAQ